MSREQLNALAITLGPLLVWLVWARIETWRIRPSSVTAGPSTMELRGEPPAIVNVLVNDWRITSDAAPATLLDLAARGFLELYQPGSDASGTLVRTTGRSTAGLATFELMVLQRVERACAGGAFVLLAEVATRQAEYGRGWHRQFFTAVKVEMKRRGLSDKAHEESMGLVIGSVLVAGILSCGALAQIMPAETLSSLWGVAATLVLMMVVFILMVGLIVAWGPVNHDTPEGREAAAHWLGVRDWIDAHESVTELPPAAVAIWNSYIAYGVALGVIPTARAAADMSVGKVDELSLPSNVGAPAVRVRYPRIVPGFGIPSGIKVVWSLVIIGFWVGAAWLGRDWVATKPKWVFYLLATVAVIQIGRSLYRALRAVLDLLFPRTISGTVLSLGQTDSTEGNDLARRWFLVLDEGKGVNRLRPWVIGPRFERKSCTVGDRVTIVAQPYSRYVKNITVSDRPAQHDRSTAEMVKAQWNSRGASG